MNTDANHSDTGIEQKIAKETKGLWFAPSFVPFADFCRKVWNSGLGMPDPCGSVQSVVKHREIDLMAALAPLVLL
jgi:hypothetical protein